MYSVNMDKIHYGFGLSRNTKFRKVIPPQPTERSAWELLAQHIFDTPYVVECCDKKMTRSITRVCGLGLHKHMVPPRVNQIGRRIGSIDRGARIFMCKLQSKLQNADTALMHFNMATLSLFTTVVQIFSKEYEHQCGDVTFERLGISVNMSMHQYDRFYSIRVSNNQGEMYFVSKSGVYDKEVTLGGTYFVKADDMVKWLTDNLSPRLIALVFPPAPASGV